MTRNDILRIWPNASESTIRANLDTDNGGICAVQSQTVKPAPLDASEKEIGKHGLQGEIMGWCDAQWPKWVYDFPRTDLKSTLPIGRHDATIWGPFPKCFLIETKAKGKKRTEQQLIWAARLNALGWEVRVIYSLNEFKEITANELTGGD